MKTTLDNAIDSLEIHKRSVLPMAQFCTELTLVLNAARLVESSPPNMTFSNDIESLLMASGLGDSQLSSSCSQPPETWKGCHPSHAREIRELQKRIDAIRTLPPMANVHCHAKNIPIFIDFANFVEMFRGRKCLVKDDGWYTLISEDGVEYHAQKRQQPQQPQEVIL